MFLSKITFCLSACCALIFCHLALGQELKNSVEVGFRNESWNGGLPNRNYTFFQYGRKINSHNLFGRVNLLWRNNQLGSQYEVDFYPKFTPKSYGYINVGVSSFFLFPKFKTGIEYYRTIAKQWEVSLGLRSTHPKGLDIYSITGTVGVYYSNWFSYVRPIVSLLNGSTAVSMLVSTRRYFGEGYSYLEILLFRGNDTGEVINLNSAENSLGLESYLFRLKAQVRLNTKYTLAGGVDYSGIFIVQRNKYIQAVSLDIMIRRSF